MLFVGDDAHIVLPVRPAGGFLLVKIYEIFHVVRRGRCPHRPACVRKALHYKDNHALCTA